MAQITVKAAARVLGLRLGQTATFEESSLLRSLIAGGKLLDETPAPPVAEQPVDEPSAEAEAVSRAKHPAFRRRAEGAEVP